MQAIKRIRSQTLSQLPGHTYHKFGVVHTEALYMLM